MSGPDGVRDGVDCSTPPGQKTWSRGRAGPVDLSLQEVVAASAPHGAAWDTVHLEGSPEHSYACTSSLCRSGGGH